MRRVLRGPALLPEPGVLAALTISPVVAPPSGPGRSRVSHRFVVHGRLKVNLKKNVLRNRCFWLPGTGESTEYGKYGKSVS